MADDEHSLFSASGSDGWIFCNGKPAMENGRNSRTRFSDEGTAAHFLGQVVGTDRLAGKPTTARDFIGRKIGVNAAGNAAWLTGERVPGTTAQFEVDADMAEHVDTYVDAFMAMSEGRRTVRFVEQRLNYARFLGVAEHLAWGTGDGIAIVLDAPAIDWEDEDGETHHFPAGVEAQIHDLKYGMGVRVFAPKSGQGRHYALGVLNDYELVAHITRVRIIMHQPRLDHVSEEVISVEDLLAWCEEFPKAAAPEVLRLYETFKPPAGGYQHYRDVPKELAASLRPSEKGCRFCDGKAVCPALIAEASQFATAGARSSAEDFEDLMVDTPRDVKAYGDNWLAMAADKLDLIDTLRKAIRAEIDNRVLSRGLVVEGFKIVEGAMGDRKWTSEGAAENALRAMRLTPAQMYKSKVISPTQAEKLLKKNSPHFASLAPLITRTPGAPSVVRIQDRRPVYTGHRASADDFQDMTAGAGVPATHSASDHPFR